MPNILDMPPAELNRFIAEALGYSVRYADYNETRESGLCYALVYPDGSVGMFATEQLAWDWLDNWAGSIDETVEACEARGWRISLAAFEDSFETTGYDAFIYAEKGFYTATAPTAALALARAFALALEGTPHAD